MCLNNYFKEKRKIIDQALKELLPNSNKYPEVINSAINYSVFSGGKRLRPILTLATSELINGRYEDSLVSACAIECIHTYSLIHDDLPAMDDSDYRRGHLTCHKKYNEAIAVLAGDALLTYAFQLLSKNNNIKAETVLKVISEISLAVGIEGLIGGQVVDLESENKVITEDILHYIHDNKTGALIITAIRIGAILSGANEEQLDSLTKYGKSIGLAFQITDDILDIVGDADNIGKPVGNDSKLNKQTFPVIYGLDEAKLLAEKEINIAIESLNCFGNKADILKQIAYYILDRNK